MSQELRYEHRTKEYSCRDARNVISGLIERKPKDGKNMKNQYTVKVHLSEELLRKLLYVSEKENRTPNNQFLFMLRNNLQYFERTKGKIAPADLKGVDITPYTEGDGE